ncbi:hypothetical protein FOCG_03435 [Fusarium oxysporum f. sp. radicis-lycopersici 26381]|uniref:Uncharacterized protein n=1 Tax=Fusarium oxysporum Fo47 TaxID=660027 RepID=W9KE38_FUSOX|nr:hypothetical protein FOZG_06421 [Fusarium oxysporum Fo47]EXL60604.1 hypothetical protein FOCG_03435 [Fusarium oxysporum f. sp. radicis-lycopersici 26381]
MISLWPASSEDQSEGGGDLAAPRAPHSHGKAAQDQQKLVSLVRCIKHPEPTLFQKVFGVL